MILTESNYFGAEAMAHYMSQSQFKQFENCEAQAMAILRGEADDEKDAYIEGRYFEAIICGKQAEFEAEYADQVLSSRGATKGMPKANYQNVIESASAFMRQPEFMDIVCKCEQQKILTGEIAGVPFKCKLDFFDKETLSEWDSKCMKDFKRLYDEKEMHYASWYFVRGYHYQAAISRELIRQNFGDCGSCGLLAATKERVPDLAWLVFDDSVLDNALEIVETFAPQYAAIKRGEIAPERCERCDYCKSTKIITEPDVILVYE